jgi:hypothetical protein
MSPGPPAMPTPLPPSIATMSGVLPTLRLAIGPPPPSADLRRPFEVGAVLDQELERCDVGGDGGPEERRAVLEGIAAHRRRMHLTDVEACSGPRPHRAADESGRALSARSGDRHAGCVPSFASQSVVASRISTARYSEPSFGSAPSSSSFAAKSKRSLMIASIIGRRTVAVRHIDVGPAVEQAPDDGLVAVTRGPHQCREAAGREIHPRAAPRQLRLARAHVRVGAGLQQGVDDLDVPLGRGPHQRRLMPRRLDGIRIAAALEEQGHGLDAARARRGHQRRFTLGTAADFEVPRRPSSSAADDGVCLRIDSPAAAA